ncbi:MAG: hypothetical protein ACTSXO_10480 [Candidatus Heimdallarchaeota archaeon]|nr:hypothetical protein [Candidatus Heimdallarchaeota archaeon]RLI68714.1 MAG: hypothetical protein DRO63_02190 [Candidatus Gerdarchaeota archaeon]RLI71585.1 MAG: hypothetical protein DRP02_04355 [Candidatus Gerdarchaeota archaeon]RLI73945.1 MAG: hypothetical protein DRO91_01780 [Candidatus Heimdallarchaeota archaeon]
MDLKDQPSIRESLAFKEYEKGYNKKLRPPWLTISLSGIAVAIAYVLTEFFATYILENPYALNFVLALYGIPAGFICAWKNQNYTILTSLQYSTYSALISVGSYGFIALLTLIFTKSHSFGLIFGFVELLIALLIIAVFSICVTFAIGAAIGTIVHANVVAKRSRS